MSDVLHMETATSSWRRIAAFVELAKPRIAILVLVVTALGYYLALPFAAGVGSLALLIHTLAGTALIASGANALNQVMEAPFDGRMARTQNRPIPSGRLSAGEARAFALTLSITGFGYLLLLVNPLTALVAGSSLLIYVLLYTPLKRRTWLCVFVGAVSGAFPPVIGWAAGAGTLTWMALVPFGVLFFWQLPHFASIAWLYRDDYRRGGYPLLPVIDVGVSRTSRHLLAHTAWLIIVSCIPAFVGFSNVRYAAEAVVLGLAFLFFGIRFVVRQTRDSARAHVLASVVYLPLIFALMILGKTAPP
jgi:protoheme IX farnesyltransferase